jgi:hypothetical protein
MILASTLLAQERTVQIKATVDVATITIGDVVRLTVEATRPKATKVVFPSVGSKLGEWVVRDSQLLPPKEIAPDLVIDSLRLQLTIYKTGDVEIPTLTVEVVKDQGRKETVSSQPIKVKVQSVLDGEQLKEIKHQAEIPADYKPLFLLLAALAALALIVFRVVQFLKSRKRSAIAEPQDSRPPAEVARQAIQSLLAKKLLESGFIKEFYLELSEILKRYLGCRFGVISLERTTEEFLHDLKQAAISWEDTQRIKTFLMDCDLVKFAKYRPPGDETRQIVERSFEIIDAAESRRPDLTPLEVSNHAGS